MIYQTTCARRSMNFKQVKDKKTTPKTVEQQRQMKNIMAAPRGGTFHYIVQRLGAEFSAKTMKKKTFKRATVV